MHAFLKSVFPLCDLPLLFIYNYYAMLS